MCLGCIIYLCVAILVAKHLLLPLVVLVCCSFLSFSYARDPGGVPFKLCQSKTLMVSESSGWKQTVFVPTFNVTVQFPRSRSFVLNVLPERYLRSEQGRAQTPTILRLAAVVCFKRGLTVRVFVVTSLSTVAVSKNLASATLASPCCVSSDFFELGALVSRAEQNMYRIT